MVCHPPKEPLKFTFRESTVFVRTANSTFRGLSQESRVSFENSKVANISGNLYGTACTRCNGILFTTVVYARDKLSALSYPLSETLFHRALRGNKLETAGSLF